MPLGLAGGGVLLVSVVSFFRVPLLPSIGDSLSLSAAQLGLLTMTFGIGRLVTDLPAGWLLGRIQPEIGFAVACVLVSSGAFLLAGSTTGVQACAATAVIGAGSSMSNTTGMTTFADVPSGRRGMAMAAFSACLLCGQAFGPAVGGTIATFGSWQSAMHVAALAGTCAAVLLAVVYLARRGRQRAFGPSAGASVTAKPPPLAWRERVILAAVPFVVFFEMASMSQTLVPIIGADALRLDAGTVGVALGIGGLARLAGAFAGGFVSDRVGRKAALVPGLLVMSCGAALIALDAGFWVWLLGILGMSLGSFGVSIAATMLADRSHRASVSRRFGGFRFCGDVGLVAGPVLAGLLFDHYGRAPAVAFAASLPAVVAVAVLVGLAETGRRRPRRPR